jgi:hypothetical protein
MTVYARHYAPRAKYETTWTPPTQLMRADLRNQPVCRTRGRLDVTADRDRVTCGACKTRMAKMPVVPLGAAR